MTEEEEGQIQDHLTVCEDCALLLLSLSEFEQYRPELDAAAGEDPSAAAWLRFRDRLREEEDAEASAQEEETRTSVVQPLQRRKVPVWEKAGVAWAVAAVLALCVVGLGIRDMNPPAPSAERSEFEFMDYVPLSDSVIRGGGEEGTVESADPPAEKAAFELPVSEVPQAATYDVAFFAVDQREPLWTGRRQHSGKYLVVGVPRSSLAPGAYRFEVHRIEGDGSRTLVGNFPYEVP